MNAFSHSAGGVGGVFGSKKLKAIAVRGSGSIKIAADKQDWKKLRRYVLSHHGRKQPARRPQHASAVGGILFAPQPLDRPQGTVLGRRQSCRSRPENAGPKN